MALCQLIDVGVNRPIKHAMAEQWEDWIDSEGVQNSNAMTTPPHELIAIGSSKHTGPSKRRPARKLGQKKDLNGLCNEIIINVTN